MGCFELRNLSYHYRIHREQILNERDAKIEAEGKLMALEGATAKETKGYIIKGAKSLSIRDKKSSAKKFYHRMSLQNIFLMKQKSG